MVSKSENHTHNISDWLHSHSYDDELHVETMQRRMLTVAIITAIMMVAEIAGGWYFGSMAVLADGWHMGTHALALGLAFFSYWYAKRNSSIGRFTFGTGKVNTLGAFASAMFLGMVGFLMIETSINRFFHQEQIKYFEALLVAIAGLIVNIVSAFIMAFRSKKEGDHEHHGSLHGHRDHHHGHDHNFRAAYIHVLSDAATSVLAIIALFGAMTWGWIWLDPLMGIIGAVLILFWAAGLINTTGRILLDAAVVDTTFTEIRKKLESIPGTSVTDLHVWYIANHKKAAMVSIVADNPEWPVIYKNHLKNVADLDHITVEVNQCEHCGKQ